MADLEFKNTNFILQKGWKVFSKGTTVGQDKYHPDISIKDSNNKFTCILESTSTNDRKVGLGELLLAEKLFVDEECKGILVFSLSGTGKQSPRPETQIKYIRPYFDFLKKVNKNIGVISIYFIKESDFKNAQWELFSKKFEEKSEKLIVNI